MKDKNTAAAIEALEASIGTHKIVIADSNVSGLARTWAADALTRRALRPES